MRPFVSRWTVSGLITVFPLLAAVGCSDPRSGSGAAAGVRDSAGVAIVENHGSPAPAPLAVAPTPVLELGAVDGEGAEQFGRIAGVTRLSDGTVVVLEGQSNELRFFDAGGVHVRTVGGTGQGPGELRSAGSLTRSTGDTLLVRDHADRYGTAVFAPTGEFIRTVRLDPVAHRERGPWAESCPFLPPVADASFLVCGLMDDADGGRPAPRWGEQAGPFRNSFQLVRVPAGAGEAARLGLFSTPESHIFLFPDGFFWVTHPWHSTSHLATSYDPARVYLARNPAYSIEVWGAEGDLERIVRRVDGRFAPSEAELEAAWAQVMEGRTGERATRIRRELTVPDSVPAVYGLTAGPDGELWVQRTPHLRTQSESRFDVFDGEGRFVAEVVIPRRLALLDVGDDYILGVGTDALDVPFVLVYPLRRR
jgi:hypothetical protein